MTSARFALYFTAKPGSALDRLGASCLGYDAATGEEVPLPLLAGIDPVAQRAVTEEPRRYGFHATLKAPFRLRDPGGGEALTDELRAFAALAGPVDLGRLRLAELGRFLALVPHGPSVALDLLAAEITASFDRHRARATEAELARRRSAALSARQDARLIRWGYPYVFDEYRFHMTLTGRLADEARPAWRSALEPLFADLPPVTLDAVSLLRQETPEDRFRLVERVLLRGEP